MAERITLRPLRFYCQGCEQYTAHDDYTDDELETLADGGEVNPHCIRCREPFQCGECGYEIDQYGTCLREEGHDA